MTGETTITQHRCSARIAPEAQLEGESLGVGTLIGIYSRCAACLHVQLERLQQLRERVAEKFDITSSSHQVGRMAGLYAPSAWGKGVLAVVLPRLGDGRKAARGSWLLRPYRDRGQP